MCIQCARTVRTYFEYDTIVQTDVVYVDEQTFPAVTVCNGNPLQRSLVVNDAVTEKDVCSAAPWFFDKKWSEQHHGINYSTCSANRAKAGLIGYTRKHREKGFVPAGIEQDRFILQCSFSKVENCAENITVKVSSHYGNCFTVGGGHGARTARGVPLLSSLDLTLFADMANNSYLLSSNSLRLIIHHPSLPAFPFEQGMDIPLTKQTIISVRQKTIERLPKPYKTDCLDDTDEGSRDEVLDNSIYFSPETGIGYSFGDCRRTCAQREFIAHTGCTIMGFPRSGRALGVHPSSPVPYCTTEVNKFIESKQKLLAVNFTMDKICSKRCKPRCHDSVYSLMPMTVAWPNKLQFSDMQLRFPEVLNIADEDAVADLLPAEPFLHPAIVYLHEVLFSTKHGAVRRPPESRAVHALTVKRIPGFRYDGESMEFDDIRKDVANKTAFQRRYRLLVTGTRDQEVDTLLNTSGTHLGDALAHDTHNFYSLVFEDLGPCAVLDWDLGQSFRNLSYERYPCSMDAMKDVNCADTKIFPGGNYKLYTRSPCLRCSKFFAKGSPAGGGDNTDCPKEHYTCLSPECTRMICCYAKNILRELSMDENLIRHLYLGKIPADAVSEYRTVLSNIQEQVVNTFKRRSLARVVVHFDSMQVEKVKHLASMPFDSLVSSLGGLLGLFLGISIVTFAEVLEFFLDCLIIVFLHLTGKTFR